MIRAGRRELVRTREDLARSMGMAMGTFRNKQPYKAEGFPAPISSKGARVFLWDGEQTDAYLAGEEIPELPGAGEDQDLLDRQEAAAVLGVTPQTWDKYKTHPQIVPHAVVVGGVEHWPRVIVQSFKEARDAPKTDAGGRPRGSGDMVPRDELPVRVAEMLDADPAVTIEQVTDALDIAFTTAKRNLFQLRGKRIADRLQAEPGLTPEQAAAALGYTPAVHKAALEVAGFELRARQVQPYLQGVADALAGQGLAPVQTVEVRRLGEEHLAAAVQLGAGGEVPALVWDERFGWRTAVSRRHPIGKDAATAPEGDGIRYLGGSRQPEAAELAAGLGDQRLGTKQPR
ncbi:DUF6292 family protein [Streptomyces sp. NPDC050485]|uniref:DUF6292 family protein n=1 Tax=Streptomyces sp. NPDC050485 TaxID=3365617 RepID=UPI0037B426A4